MGEFDDEIVATPAEDEPTEAESEPIEISPEPSLGEEPPAEEPAQELTAEESAAPAVQEPAEEPAPAEDATAAIPDQLAFEELAVAATPEASDVEPEPETSTSDEDLAAAIAASTEQVGAQGTFDDIAPGTAPAVAAEEIDAEEPTRYGAPWWPFLIYLVLWFAFAGIAVWQLQQLPQDVIAYETQQYTLFVFGGLALAVSGVLLVLAVWLGARISPKRHRKGLFSSALVMGAVAILIGVVVWWGAIMALDYLRLGRLI